MDDYGIYDKVQWVKILIKVGTEINRKLHREKRDLEKEGNANLICYQFSWIYKGSIHAYVYCAFQIIIPCLS